MRVNRQNGRRDRRRPLRWDESERTMGPVFVVVQRVDANDTLEVAATDDQEVVEAVAADGADPPLRVGVRVRRPDRRPDHPHTLGTEDLIEAAVELRVAVMDEQPDSSIRRVASEMKNST